MLNNTKLKKKIMARLSAEIKQTIEEEAQEEDVLVDLGWCEIGDDGVYYLSKVINKKTEMLNLYRNQVTEGGLKYLLRAGLQSLRFLNLGMNMIGNIGVKLLTRCQWINLEELEMVECQLDGSGLSHLQKGIWPKLEFLSLSYNKVGSGVDRLVRGNWKKIKRIHFSSFSSIEAQGKFVTEEGIKIILARWKKLKNINITMDKDKMDWSGKNRRRVSIYWKFWEIEKIKMALKAKFRKIQQLFVMYE